MRRGLQGIVALLLAFAGTASAAEAGVLRAEAGGYGEETISYEVGRGPASVIIVRSFDGGRLELTDRSALIRLGSPDSPIALRCRLHGAHTAVCRAPAPYPLGNLKITGGAHNDVIDARRVLADDVRLEGGGGDDTLLAPRRVPHAYAITTLVGGPGSNVIVGGPDASVSYTEARGPVRVDLARGLGLAHRERDHLVRVPGVEGSQSAFNTLSGSREGGPIWGGGEGNTIVARSSRTVIDFAQSRNESLSFPPTLEGRVRVPSRIHCDAFSQVDDPAPDDVLLGRCRVHDVVLHLPMRTTASAPVTVDDPQSAGDDRRVVLTAGSRVLGEAVGTPGKLVACLLNAAGRRLLRSQRQLRVRVDETIVSPAYPDFHQPWARFSTVLSLRRG